MADHINPVKVNGFPTAPDQAFGAGFALFTVSATTAACDLGSKYVLDAVIKTISLTCAPLVLGTVTGTTTKTLNFAVDRLGVIVAATLQAALVALGTTSVGTVFDVNGDATAFADFTGVTVAIMAF